jgi:hypothetical protein
MIRDAVSHWEQHEYCLECGKSRIEERVEEMRIAVEDCNLEVFKKDFDKFKEQLNFVNAKLEVKNRNDFSANVSAK